MTEHLKLSRITKPLTDSQGIEFILAEQRLASVYIAIVADEISRTSIAGQAALLMALATSRKVFNHVVLVSSKDIGLRRPIPGANTLISAAHILGVDVSQEIPATTTHTIIFDASQSGHGFIVRCWWDRWCAGVLPKWDTRPLGEDWNPLAGSFAGALAIREIFAQILGSRVNNPRTSVISIWEPWKKAEDAESGPTNIFIPKNLWIVGLGHLGQGFLWNLGMLPAHGEKLVLQDYQYAGIENEATGLLTTHTCIGMRKTRVAARWIEQFGWKTELIERKITSETKISPDDPSLVISGLDNPRPRLDVLNAGFAYMIDSGVGHGPVDFESSQIRVFAKGDAPSWSHGIPNRGRESLMEKAPYKTIAKSNPCGAFQLADASVAVPFVGAAIGALAVTQALRLAAMLEAPSLIQIELSAPDFSSANRLAPKPTVGLGCVSLNLKTGEFTP